jgi:hypothetical protein
MRKHFLIAQDANFRCKHFFLVANVRDDKESSESIWNYTGLNKNYKEASWLPNYRWFICCPMPKIRKDKSDKRCCFEPISDGEEATISNEISSPFSKYGVSTS